MPPADTDTSRFNEFAAGARDMLPMLLGAAPFGVIFGTLVTASPVPAWQGQFMSLSVFAGSSQFIGIGLIDSHAGFLVVWATTLIVNLRHVLYGATLLPYVQRLPWRWRMLLGMLITDEMFAVSVASQRRQPGRLYGHWHMFGSGVAMYLNWQGWTLVGLIFGSAFPGLQALGLDFAMVATFIAIVVPQLNTLRSLAAALSAGALAYAWQDWPYKLGLLAAVLCGIGVGLVLSRGVRVEAAAGEAAP